ncbi:MAG: aldehyde dehydrogenase family protein [Emcibacter sp.]|nr:aldehyde dehydrogenase family protein [Emcibacter sp.]
MTSGDHKYLPYGRQFLDEDDIQAVSDVLRGDWLTTGPTVAAFEDKFRTVAGSDHVVSCSSGTAALHMAYMALGLCPGDRVIVPSISFIATANGALYCGADVLFTDVDPDSGLARDEIFGPVQVVLPFDDEADAVELANGTEYGLVAGVWTSNGARQMRLARAIRSGQVFINNYGAGGGVELPFGGVGKSGNGREKGFEALYGFSVLKTVAARHG